MHGGQKSGRARLEQRLPAPGVPWEGGIAVRGTLNAVPAPRDYFSPVSADRDHRGKIVPRCRDRIQGTPDRDSGTPARVQHGGPYGTSQNLHNNHSTNT